MRAILALFTTLLLSGCVSTAASIITAPVRAAGQAADWATTSQDEADRNLGRALREREEQLGRLDRQRHRATEKCEDGDEDACADIARIDAQIEDLQGARTPR
ncbi:MAG: hypothetical protein ABL874_05790 [Sphingopyxis sp.]